MIKIILLYLFACSSTDTKTEDSGEFTPDTDTSIEDTSSEDTDTDTDISISNVGPSGNSIAINDCAPWDGWAVTFNVGMGESNNCEEEPPDDFWVRLYLYPDRNDFTSGIEVPLGTSSDVQGQALYHDSGLEQAAVDGAVTLEWMNAWDDGVSYTGYYWIELESGLIMEGSFSGVHCGGETFCG